MRINERKVEDYMDAIENMENYCNEKLGTPTVWQMSRIERVPSLSTHIQTALNEPFSGAVVFDKINQTKSQLEGIPARKQAQIIEQLWQELHSHLNESHQ